MERTGWRRRRLPGGLALHRREQKEERKSLRHSSFLSTHLSVSAFSFPRFHTTSGLALSFFFLFSTPLLDSSHCFLFFLPVQAFTVYVRSSFILFFHSFHSSLSLLGTFFPLLPLCVCFYHILNAPSFHRERAWREICASAV